MDQPIGIPKSLENGKVAIEEPKAATLETAQPRALPVKLSASNAAPQLAASNPNPNPMPVALALIGLVLIVSLKR